MVGLVGLLSNKLFVQGANKKRKAKELTIRSQATAPPIKARIPCADDTYRGVFHSPRDAGLPATFALIPAATSDIGNHSWEPSGFQCTGKANQTSFTAEGSVDQLYTLYKEMGSIDHK